MKSPCWACCGVRSSACWTKRFFGWRNIRKGLHAGLFAEKFPPELGEEQALRAEFAAETLGNFAR